MNTKIRKKIKLDTLWNKGEEFIHEFDPKTNARSTFDPQLITREYYNGSAFDVILKSHHESDFGKIYKLPKDGFCIVGHGYFTPYILEKSSSFDNPKFLAIGTTISGILINFGELIGKGNKKPSKDTVVC